MKKWAKRFFLFGGGLLLLVIIGVAIEWQITVGRAKDQLMKARAALDAAEPGWKLDELIAKRNANLPPDDQNVAVIALAAIKMFPEDFNRWEGTEANWRGELKLGHLADPKDLAEAREHLTPLAPGLTALREIRKYPRGGVKIDFPDANPMGFLLTDTQKMREAASKLDWQALLAANDNEPATALDAARTLAHLRHAIGDEPTLISQLMRMAITAIAVRSAERTLALTEPKAGLVELQADFEKAMTERYMIAGIEGERALQDRIMENMANGKLAAGMGGGGNGGFVSTLENIALSRFVRPNHVMLLEIVTAMRDAMKKPGPERKKAMDAVPIPKGRSITNIFVSLLVPAMEKVVQAETRSEAMLGSVVVALACERYRIQHGKWPESLNDIPKELLSAIPLDPYVGGPVKYKRTETGIVVYTTGLDEKDDGGVELEASGNKPTADVGIRFFDPAHRRKPPLPSPKEKDDLDDIPPPP